MSNEEKEQKLVYKPDPSTMEEVHARINNREVLRESFSIALKMLDRLDELNWTQVQLAKKLDVSPQQVNKILRGKENLTLETQIKLQEVLNIPILASFYEKREKEMVNQILILKKKIQHIEAVSSQGLHNYRPSSITKKHRKTFTKEKFELV